VTRTIRKYKSPNPDIKKQEDLVLTNVKDKNIIILPTDK